MNNSKLLISSCILCALSNSALADMDIRGERTSFYERNKPKPIGFNYTFIETTYTYSTVDNPALTDDNVQGVGAKISFSLIPSLSAQLKISGSGQTYNNDFLESTEIYLGVNYHHSFNKDLEGYVEFNTISIDSEDPIDSDLTISSTGNSLSFGIRQRINPKMEWGFRLAAVDIEDDTNAKIHLDYSYGSDDEIQYLAGFEITDTDNKIATLILGIRFNY